MGKRCSNTDNALLKLQMRMEIKLNPEQIYSVAVNNFVATGGDGFTVFKEGTNVVTGPTDLDAMVEYIKNYEGTISAPELDRVEVR